MRSIIYLLYTYDIPQIENVTKAPFADDMVLLAIGDDSKGTARKFEQVSSSVNILTNEWRTQINETKLLQVDFAYKHHAYYAGNNKLY